MRTCPRCNELLPECEFRQLRGRGKRRARLCEPCELYAQYELALARQRQRREDILEKVREINRRFDRSE